MRGEEENEERGEQKVSLTAWDYGEKWSQGSYIPGYN